MILPPRLDTEVMAVGVFRYSIFVYHYILAIFYPSLKYIVGYFGLFLQSKKVNIYLAELAERVEYGNYAFIIILLSLFIL